METDIYPNNAREKFERVLQNRHCEPTLFILSLSFNTESNITFTSKLSLKCSITSKKTYLNSRLLSHCFFLSADFITDNNKPLQKKGMISAQMDNNNGQSVAAQQQQQQQLQQQHTTNSTERSYYNPSRRKTTVYENRASTYNMNRYKNKIIGKHNGCPWRPPNFEYGPGVLG